MAEHTPVRRVDFDAMPGVRDPARLASLERAVLCDTEPEPSFDRLTDLIVQLLRVPVALVSLVDHERQFFKAQRGLPEPWATTRQTPLSHSFCQYLVASDAPLVIEDSRQDPTLHANGAVADLGVVAYAGFPIRGADQHAIGSLCAIDSRPRRWSDDELTMLAHLAEVTSDLVQVRTTAMVAEDRRDRIAQLVESQEQERSRIAAELHDDSLQSLAALSIRLQLIERAGGDHAADVGEIAHALHETARRMRRFVSGLRPDAFEHDTLLNVLHAHLDDRTTDHPDVTLEATGELSDEPAEPVRITLFRIAQQAVDNALAHARPTVVRVDVSSADSRTTLRITDDGIGFDPTESPSDRSFGLRIMRERAELHDGELLIESAPGAGTTIAATIPI